MCAKSPTFVAMDGVDRHTEALQHARRTRPITSPQCSAAAALNRRRWSWLSHPDQPGVMIPHHCTCSVRVEFAMSISRVTRTLPRPRPVPNGRFVGAKPAVHRHNRASPGSPIHFSATNLSPNPHRPSADKTCVAASLRSRRRFEATPPTNGLVSPTVRRRRTATAEGTAPASM